jgi:hypothetical protein
MYAVSPDFDPLSESAICFRSSLLLKCGQGVYIQHLDQLQGEQVQGYLVKLSTGFPLAWIPSLCYVY